MCPQCGAPLEVPPAGVASVVCSFCSTLVIVPPELREGPTEAPTDTSTGPQSVTLTSHIAAVIQVAWSPDGQQLASASLDHTIRLWSATSAKPLQTFLGHTGGVVSIAWSPDGSQLASGAQDHTVRLWLVANGRAWPALVGHTDEVTSVAWSPDGRRVASGAYDQTVRLWDMAGQI